MAEVIRRFIDRGLSDEPSGRDHLYDRAATLVGGFDDRDGATDLGEGHDAYLDRAYE